jgi:hypothetical protein
MAIVSVIAVASVCMLVFGLIAQAGPPPQEKGGLRIEVTTDKDSYDIGEQISVTVAIRNTGASTIEYPPLIAWSDDDTDNLAGLQIRFYGAGYFRGAARVRGILYPEGSYGLKKSFSPEPERLGPGQQRSATFQIPAMSPESIRIEANFFIANKCYTLIAPKEDGASSQDTLDVPPEVVDIPSGWIGLIRASTTVTVVDSVVTEDAEDLQRLQTSLRYVDEQTRHVSMRDIAEYYPYSGHSLLLAGLDNSEVVRSDEDRRMLVKALADLLRRCYIRDVLERLFQISLDTNEDIEVRIAALQAYYLLTPKYLKKEGFVLQPEEDLLNQFSANIIQLKLSPLDKIKNEAARIEKWYEDSVVIDP